MSSLSRIRGTQLWLYGRLVLVGALASTLVAADFGPRSWWNRPLDASGRAPVHPRSEAFIADSLDPDHTQPWLRLTVSPLWAQPIFRSTCEDRKYTITPAKYGKRVRLHIPVKARPASGTDAQLTIYDRCKGAVFGLWQASYKRTWRANGTERYFLASNGLAGTLPQSNDVRNFGHRGVPPSVRAVTVREIRAGVVDHRLSCFWHATAESHYWPMTAHEKDKGGIVPEGIVIRIKPRVRLRRFVSGAALVIARALKHYGCLIGDNSGSGNHLKLQLADWSDHGLRPRSLSKLTFDKWEFVRGGYRP
jgi:hypothetical protein